MACKWCGRYQKAHEVQSCPHFQSALARGVIRAVKIQAKIQSGGKRVCGYCANAEHASTKCPKRFNDEKHKLTTIFTKAEEAFKWLHEIGFGPGAMLSGMANERYYNSRNKEEKIVVIEDFTQSVAHRFMQELINGTQRNWYQVNAVDISQERIRKIYLPFHAVYAPKPTSLKVSVIQKASPDEIDKMKLHFDCYLSPIMNFNTAEEFFAAGFKFKAGSSDVVAPA